MLPTYLTASDAAKALGVTTATVRLMHKRGALLPVATTVAGIRLFDRDVVEELVQARKERAARAVA